MHGDCTCGTTYPCLFSAHVATRTIQMEEISLNYSCSLGVMVDYEFLKSKQVFNTSFHYS